MDNNMILLAGILVSGIVAQWIAWRIQLPAILPLLLSGILIGPITGIADPDALLGPILMPSVSFAVALILFEGGLGLKIRELTSVGTAFYRLISIGAITTFLLSFLGAYYVLGLSLQVSAMLSSILIVTGPTVILPILRQIRLKPELSSLLKWEGIVIDPIGAIFAVLTYEVIQVSQLGDATPLILMGFMKTLIVGGSLGFSMAFLLIAFINWRLIPDFLHIPVTIALVMGAFVASNALQPESGLLTTTLMGIVLANQKWISVKRILEFKENLGILILSVLFIVLAARLKLDDLLMIQKESFVFLAFLVFVIRPVSVFLSTAGTRLTIGEKSFVSAMAPRGIVAASVAVVFQEKMNDIGIYDSNRLTPLIFQIIIVTVLFYGFSAYPLAKKLKLMRTRLNGVLFVGAHEWARKMAKALKEHKIPVLMVDVNPQNVNLAQKEGINAFAGDILSDEFRDSELLFKDMGNILSMTANDAVNTLAVQGYKELFGDKTYQLAQGNGKMSKALQGQIPFGENATHERLDSCFLEDGEILYEDINDLDINQFKISHGMIYPLFLLNSDGDLQIYTTAINSINNYKGLIYLKTKS